MKSQHWLESYNWGCLHEWIDSYMKKLTMQLVLHAFFKEYTTLENKELTHEANWSNQCIKMLFHSVASINPWCKKLTPVKGNKKRLCHQNMFSYVNWIKVFMSDCY